MTLHTKKQWCNDQMETSIELRMSNRYRRTMNDLANCSWWVGSGEWKSATMDIIVDHCGTMGRAMTKWRAKLSAAHGKCLTTWRMTTLILVGGWEEGGEKGSRAATMGIIVGYYCSTIRRVMTKLMVELNSEGRRGISTLE